MINKKYLLDLQFFAEKDDKTEEPTAHKRQKAREEGQVPKSQEINTAAVFLIAFPFLKLTVPGMIENMHGVFVSMYSKISSPDVEYGAKYMADLVSFLFGKIIIMVAPLFVVVMAIGIIVNFVQVGWHPTLKPMAPKFNKVNPISGFKRLFSKQALVELAKSLLKVIIISLIFYSELMGQINKIPQLFDMDIKDSMALIGNICIGLAVKTGIFMVFIAAGDYAFHRYTHHKNIKMSKQEVKEEYKNQEGDPHVKGQIKQRMREISMRRMMQDVPKADVIITNPTHFAVALKYDKDKAEAPFVIAKGADIIAKRIREIGKENNVEIVENKQLARALYASVDINQVIPQDLYQAVAEILTFVYNLKKKV